MRDNMIELELLSKRASQSFSRKIRHICTKYLIKRIHISIKKL